MKHTRFGILLLVAAALVFLGGCTTGLKDSNPKQADIAYIYEQLPKLHVDFYHETSKAELGKAYRAAMEEAGKLGDSDFYFTLRRLAAMAKDSHTAVGFTQEIIDGLSAIPAQFSYVEGEWRLSVVGRTHAALVGGQVIAINGFPMQEMEALVAPFFSHDNEVWLRYYLSQQLNLTNLYTSAGIAESPLQPVTLTVRERSTGEEHTISLTPVPAKEYGMLSFATWYQKHPETGPNNAPYRALLLEESNTLFIQYNVCMSYEDYPLQAFIQEILDVVDSAPITHIMIDLRYNGGGDSQLLEPLVDGLGSRQAEKGFSIDVLIGEGTFSSALMDAMHFKKRTNARLVGGPSGGSVNHYGETGNFFLPNSKIPVSYSTKQFVLDENHPSGPLMPDLVIERTVDDILAGRDTVVEALLQSY